MGTKWLRENKNDFFIKVAYIFNNICDKNKWFWRKKLLGGPIRLLAVRGVSLSPPPQVGSPRPTIFLVDLKRADLNGTDWPALSSLTEI